MERRGMGMNSDGKEKAGSKIDANVIFEPLKNIKWDETKKSNIF